MAVGLFVAAMVSGGLPTLTAESLPILFISGLVGIFLGDTSLFAGLRRVGPRLNAVMFEFNAPLKAVAGIFSLDEILSLSVFLGRILVTTGVVIAVVFGQKQSSPSHWDVVHGSLPVGLLFGFLAAAGQAGGFSCHDR